MIATEPLRIESCLVVAELGCDEAVCLVLRVQYHISTRCHTTGQDTTPLVHQHRWLCFKPISLSPSLLSDRWCLSLDTFGGHEVAMLWSCTLLPSQSSVALSGRRARQCGLTPGLCHTGIRKAGRQKRKRGRRKLVFRQKRLPVRQHWGAINLAAKGETLHSVAQCSVLLSFSLSLSHTLDRSIDRH